MLRGTSIWPGERTTNQCKHYDKIASIYERVQDISKRYKDASNRNSSQLLTLKNLKLEYVSRQTEIDLKEILFNKVASAGKDAGSGLGLYNAKQAIESFHGKITAFAAHKKGTTFEITLPGT